MQKVRVENRHTSHPVNFLIVAIRRHRFFAKIYREKLGEFFGLLYIRITFTYRRLWRSQQVQTVCLGPPGV
jgi:hypothetical protein